MKKYLIAVPILVIFVSCLTLAAFTRKRSGEKDTKVANTPNGYRWVQLTDNALFSKSYNFQLFDLNNKLWAFHPDGNYYSTDGKDWTKSTLPNSINNLAFLDYIKFNNAILGLGYFNGNIESFDFKTSITKTTDLKKWETISEKSNLPKRFFYQPVVFKNKIWIFGGTDDGERKFDDAWSSTDGVNWKLEAKHLAFGSRDRENFLVFKDKLYLLDNDVWTSEDGINWKRVSPQITDVTLGGYNAVVFDEKI